MKYTLIANTGLQFTTTYLDINIEEPLILKDGKPLEYTFIEAVDFLNDCRTKVDVCAQKDGYYVPVNTLQDNGLLDVTADESGVPKMIDDFVLALVENYASDSHELMNVNSLSSFKVEQGTDTKTGFELLLGKWLPMPMYENEIYGLCNFPNGWCRVRIDAVGRKHQDGSRRYRLTWAFDTQCMDEFDMTMLRPSFPEGSPECKQFQLCSRADLLLGNFLTIPDSVNDAPVSDYLLALFGIDLDKIEVHKYKFMAYYIYLINYLRLSGASPDVNLYNKQDRQIPVDMSFDIGDTHAFAVLYEKGGSFCRPQMLKLRNMGEPWKCYQNSIDMTIAFRRVDVGGDISQDKMLFMYPSFVRVGEEAKYLVKRLLAEKSRESKQAFYFSQPQRFLWDTDKYELGWENIVLEDDATTLRIDPKIYIETFSDHFASDGSFLENVDYCDTFFDDDRVPRYSRSSLMTFAMIEILQQAVVYINSDKFRYSNGDIDCRRYLRSINITCRAALNAQEQQLLKKSVADAINVLNKITRLMVRVPEILFTDLSMFESLSDEQFAKRRYEEASGIRKVYNLSEDEVDNRIVDVLTKFGLI